MHILRGKYDYECVTEVNRLETKVSNSDAEFVDVVVPEKVTLTFILVGDLMAINEDYDVKAEGVADNLMADVVMKECFDDAEDYKVMISHPSIIEIGIPWVSFNLGGTFVTDADVERLKCYTEYSPSCQLRFFLMGFIPGPNSEVMTSPLSIIEIGIPHVSFDPGRAFRTNVEVEVHEGLKLLLITSVRNINVTPNTQGFPVLPSLGCKGVAAALWLTLARSLTVRR
ncbi:hypothetical protein Tco_0429003 [Tanacetum coccineum]